MCDIGKVLRVTNEGLPESAEEILAGIRARTAIPAEKVFQFRPPERVPVRVRKQR